MCRAAEDGAGAVIHQHEIGDIDGKRRALDDRVLHVEPGENALLLGLFQRFSGRALAMAFGDELGQGGIVGRQF